VFVVLQLQHGARVLGHRQLAEDRGLLRQVGQAQRERRWIGMCSTACPSMRMLPASARTSPTIM
jgi:transposase